MTLRSSPIVLLIGVCSLSGAWAQESKIDSLKSFLAESTNDSLRIQTLFSLSDLYQHVDIVRAKQYVEQALEISKQKQWFWAIRKSYSYFGNLSTLGGDYSAALEYDKESLVVALEQKDSSSIAIALNNIGIDHADLGQLDQAYDYFTQSYKNAEKRKDSLHMIIAMHNVGRVFKELGQYDIALSHYKIAAKMGEKINDEEGPAYLLHETGDIHLRKGEFKEAEKILVEDLALIRQLKIRALEHKALTKLAQVYYGLGEYQKAIAYYDSVEVINQKTKNEFGLAEAELGKSKVYLALNDFPRAKQLIAGSMAIAETQKANRLRVECYELLSILAEKQNDFKGSLQYFKKYKMLEDSLYSEETINKLFQKQLNVQLEGKDSQIAFLSQTRARQESEIKKQEFIRNIFVVVLALTVILLFTIYRSGQRRIRINKLLMDHQDEIKRRSLELEQLNQVKDKFFSIISHDLRSPMNALSAILDLIDKRQISQEEFTQLTKELRIQFNHTKTLINNLLDWTLLQMDKLKIQADKIDLRALVDDNFKLLSSLHLKEIQMENNIPAATFARADMNMVNLVFRNLILNAIKFTETGGIIKIDAGAQNGEITISVADSGVGIAPEVQKILFEKTSGYSTRGTANEKGTGLGLILCKEFVERNGGRIWLESELDKGSTFYFTLKKA